AFLFRGDDVEKKVKVLSGGERNRLALCMMLLRPINVLLMDEPTNHLDIKSKNVLKEALRTFEGTLVIVSHDRDFLQGLTDKVIEFKDQKIKEYLGDINYFLEQRNTKDMSDLEKKYSKEIEQKKDIVKEKKSLSYEDQKKLKALQNKISKTESKISDLEKKIAQADKELAENYEKLTNNFTWFETYEKMKMELEAAMEEWEQISEEIERNQ